MGKVLVSISMSLDGFVAGPNDRPGHGLGDGGGVLHQWTRDVDIDQLFADSGAGAMVVGRRMFDVSQSWDGNPPGGLPCFVLTHNVPLEWAKPGSAFTFVTDGIHSVIEKAREAADGKNVAVGGGADIIRQVISAGLADEIEIILVPVLLGGGVRLFEQMETGPVPLVQAGVTESRYATRLRFAVQRRP
jgi:dihydrofolate reductase